MFANLVRFPLALNLAMALLALAPSTQASAADEQSPELALEAYVNGLRTGSLERLRELFLSDGQFCSVSAEPGRRIVCNKFSEVLGGWVAKPDPLASGRIVHRKDAAQSMSAITYELNFGGDRYIDQLLLYRSEGRWWVVAKTTALQ